MGGGGGGGSGRQGREAEGRQMRANYNNVDSLATSLSLSPFLVHTSQHLAYLATLNNGDRETAASRQLKTKKKKQTVLDKVEQTADVAKLLLGKQEQTPHCDNTTKNFTTPKWRLSNDPPNYIKVLLLPE